MIKHIAIVAPGAMGAALARRLVENGATVSTLLEGRSAATRERAEAAGMQGVDLDGLAEAELILSVVPPAEALALAEKLAPALARRERKPIYADCNAVDVATVQRIAAVIEATGARFVDGGIIGLPPKPGGKGPTLYFSGPSAGALGFLTPLGIDAQIIEGAIGAASALKMSYAGITKGITAVASAMILAACQAGASDALFKELEASQPQLLQRFKTSLPDMFPKAYRWVAEMREISSFVGANPASAALYEAVAQFYEGMAEDFKGEGKETGLIREFLASSSAGEGGTKV